jgi:16S rRNA processing protein RimM
VLGAWGVRGHLKVHPLGPPEVLAAGRTVYLNGTAHTIEQAKPHQAIYHVKLAGISNREGAAAFRGLYLEVPEADLPPAGKDAYYHYQLIGLRVETTTGEPFGRVDEVRSAGGNDVFVVRGAGREVLIPAVDEIVVEVSIAEGRMIIEVVPGLLD